MFMVMAMLMAAVLEFGFFFVIMAMFVIMVVGLFGTALVMLVVMSVIMGMTMFMFMTVFSFGTHGWFCLAVVVVDLSIVLCFGIYLLFFVKIGDIIFLLSPLQP